MQPITRTKPRKSFTNVDEATAADRKFFDENPDLDEYIREFCPGEFGKMELPEILPGFRYATHVSVTLRVQGQPVGRFRRLMMICEGLPEWETP
jgi:hypothetical protein